MLPDISIKDYSYELPEERIAKYPLAERDMSKLLEYRKGEISEHGFRDLPSLLPADSIMVFNDTKVVPARMYFQRESGAIIEIFCLEPVLPVEYNLAFAATDSCVWKCLVGNAKKWKGDTLKLYVATPQSPAAAQQTVGSPAAAQQTVGSPAAASTYAEMDLRAELLERDGATATVRFVWADKEPFSNVLERCGKVPVPPYLNRESESIDSERYQTLYAKYRGSVAAPTAGLHFTEKVLSDIRDKGIDMETVCLHVGAGTFLPVKSDKLAGHSMHREPFVVSLDFLKDLRDRGARKVIAVGTTSVRTLESLYYAGVSCIEKGSPEDVGQWAPYERGYVYSTQEALDALIAWLEKEGKERLSVGTRLIIVPGFEFRVVDILVTNFHQPQSTLLLLISAFVDGNWRPIYDFALSHDFRFLSYGDSSVLFRAR